MPDLLTHHWKVLVQNRWGAQESSEEEDHWEDGSELAHQTLGQGLGQPGVTEPAKTYRPP